jgi:hypothetical protein
VTAGFTRTQRVHHVIRNQDGRWLGFDGADRSTSWVWFESGAVRVSTARLRGIGEVTR